jgi:hypothetical protein
VSFIKKLALPLRRREGETGGQGDRVIDSSIKRLIIKIAWSVASIINQLLGY